MKSSVVTTVVISLCAFLTGCAGTNFVRVPDDALVLGQTTFEQITARLGPPFEEGLLTKNDHQIRSAIYIYISLGGLGAAERVIGVRAQGFYFSNNKLVGYEFNSSWKEDSTNFDSKKVAEIKKGESTRADVVRLLGNPGGRHVYPGIPNKDEDAVSYAYNEHMGFLYDRNVHRKSLLVTFNKEGVVTNVEYAEWDPQ